MITFNFFNSLWYFPREREKKKNMKENNKRRLSWDDVGNVSSTHRFESVWKRCVKWDSHCGDVAQKEAQKICEFNLIGSNSVPSPVWFSYSSTIIIIISCLYVVALSSIFHLLCAVLYTRYKCETVRTSLSANVRATRKEEKKNQVQLIKLK